jgi:hypothetical protein
MSADCEGKRGGWLLLDAAARAPTAIFLVLIHLFCFEFLCHIYHTYIITFICISYFFKPFEKNLLHKDGPLGTILWIFQISSGYGWYSCLFKLWNLLYIYIYIYIFLFFSSSVRRPQCLKAWEMGPFETIPVR